MNLTFLLMALIPQDADLLVERLGDGDYGARERAGKMLIELGTRARPAVERALRSGDPEVRVRAEAIMGEIERAEQRQRSLGPAWRVTLPSGEHSLAAVLECLNRQTGRTLKAPAGRRETRFRTGASDMLFLEYVDRLCRDHGGLRVAEDGKGEAIELEEGVPRNGPTCYSGPFRVWIDRLRLERRDPFFGSGFARGRIVLGIGWQPNVHPVITDFGEEKPRLTVCELRGDDGGEIGLEPGGENPGRELRSPPDVNHGVRQWISFAHPVASVRRLSVIRGYADVSFPLKVETVVFARPLSSAGETRKAGEYAITLARCESTAEGVAGEIRIVGPPGRPGEQKPRVGIQGRHEHGSIDVVGEDGSVRRVRWMGSSRSPGVGGDGERYEEQFVCPPGPGVQELRLQFVTECFDRRVDFEFRDVDLP